MVCLSAAELKNVAFELHILKVLIFKAGAVHALNVSVLFLSSCNARCFLSRTVSFHTQKRKLKDAI